MERGGGMSGGSMSSSSGGVSAVASGAREGGRMGSSFSSREIGNLRSSGKTEQSMVSLKHNPKVAHSEAIAFREQGARPMIDLKQNKSHFSQEGKGYLKTGDEKRSGNIQGFGERRANSGNLNRNSQSFKNAKLEYTRQELKKIVDDNKPSGLGISEQKSQMLNGFQGQNKRQEGSTQRVFDAYKKMTARGRLAENPQKQIENLKTVKKINSQQEINKPLVKAKDSPMNNEKLRQILSQKIYAKEQFRAKVNPETKKFTGPEISIKSGANTQIQKEVKTKLQIEQQIKPSVIERLRQKIATKVSAQSRLHPITEKQIQTQVDTEVATEINTQAKTQVLAEVQAQTKSSTKVEVAEKVSPQTAKNKRVEVSVAQDDLEKKKDKKIPDNEPNKKYAYFEVDHATNDKRAQETNAAYIKARHEASLNEREQITGNDISRHMDGIRNMSAESASIDGISPDGSAELFVEHFAKAGVITSLRDLEKKQEEARQKYTATNLTEKPSNQVVGKREIVTVHKAQQFPAWMDGQQVVVQLKDDMVEAA